MLSSYLTLQSTIAAQNAAQARMMGAADSMYSAISFGASQPLGGPDTSNVSFAAAQADSFELQTKSDETKVSVFKKLADALEARLGKDIKRSTPNYGGLDVQG